MQFRVLGLVLVLLSGPMGWVACGGGAKTDPVTAPSITTQPASQTVTVGSSASFVVAASGDPVPSLQWERSADGLAWSAIDGATNSTYSFAAQAIDHGARFRAKATNSGGTATTDAAQLTVNDAPGFMAHPAAQTVVAGAAAVFSVQVSGNPVPSLQWERSADGSNWSIIDGATRANYTFSAQTADNGARFRAVATNSVSSATSNAAQLTVSPAPAVPVITTQPVSQTVMAGRSVALAVTASGYPVPSYQWERSADGTTWSAIDGATSANYSFTAQSADTGAHFRAKASNSVGTASSNAVTLTVNVPKTALTYTLPNSVSLELVAIPGGTFTMGSPSAEQDRSPDEGPQHGVTISPFYMAKFETTQAQWVALMGSNPSRFQEWGQADLNRPVEQVSHADITQAAGFLEKLNAATVATRPAGLVFRLPTEAEWEYAARAGSAARFYWGDDPNHAQFDSYVWYTSNSSGQTSNVGRKAPNAFGLFDMAGNVWEWCHDWYGAYDSSAQVDPTGPAAGSFRVMRGGSWITSHHGDHRLAHRDYGTPSVGYYTWGFRVVLASPKTH